MNPNNPQVSRALGRLSTQYGNSASVDEFFAMARQAEDLEDLRRLMSEHLQIAIEDIIELPF